MNIYCKYALNQIRIAISSMAEIIDKLDESDLQIKPTHNKHSIGELLKHMTTICKADYHISKGAAQEEMDTLYSSVSLHNLADIKEELLNNYAYLEQELMKLKDEELHQETTSYWGVTYSRYEWLLEIAAHIYHHRGQLHSMLVHCKGKDPKVQLFE